MSRLAIAFLLLLAGCAGHQAYDQGRELIRQGRIAEGFAKVDEAIRLEPQRIEYRTYLARERAIAVPRLVAAAERWRSIPTASRRARGSPRCAPSGRTPRP